MGAAQQMLLAGRGDISVLVHNVTEGGGEGAYDSGAGPCSIQFANTGVFTGSKVSGSATTPYNWLVSGFVADAEIFIHQVSGTAVTGIALDTWLALSASRGCSLAWPGGVSSSSAQVNVSIRDRLSGNVKANALPLVLNTHP